MIIQKSKRPKTIYREAAKNWPAIITSLTDKGYSLRGIAIAINVSYPTLQRWVKGSSPNYEDARALLLLAELAD